MTQIALEPYIPLALWVPLALAAAGLLAWYALSSRRRLARRRWWGVITLMSLAVAIPLVILLNPIWLERIPPPAGKPLLTVLVDHSPSMETRDSEGGKSRYEVACRIAGRMKSELEDRYEVRTRTFASGAALDGSERGHAASTDLAAAIDSGLDEDRPQGQAVLLLSDGVHNAPGGTDPVERSAAKAKAMAAPVYTKTLGGQGGVKDLEVGLNLPQELAFVGQRVPVVVSLRQRGSLGPRTRLSLVSGGKVVAQRDVELEADGTREEVFQVVEPKSGLYRYEVRAEPLAEEVTGVNNTATLVVRVVQEPVRVLLLEGKPYWDTKFLIRTLSTDRSIELTSVVKLAEGRFLKRTITRPERPPAPEGASPARAAKPDNITLGPPERPIEVPEGQRPPKDAKVAELRQVVPKTGAADTPAVAPRIDRWVIQKDAGAILVDPETLGSCQIVILGRESEVYLSDAALSRLKKWLTDGDGSLVCFRGPPASQISQRLGAMMPVRWTPARESHFRVEWTGFGAGLRWLPGSGERGTLAALPSLATVSRPQKQELAEVLAVSAGPQGEAIPAITYQPVGTGRVVVVEGAGMWRWAFLPPAHQDRDETYGVLWRSLIRWLVANVGLLPSQRLALRTDKVTFSTDESATATLLVRQDEAGGPTPEIELAGGPLQGPRKIVPVPSGSFPGQFRVPLGRLPEGRYELRVAGAGPKAVAALAAFDVRGNLKERLDVAADEGMMRTIADSSGGAVLDRAEPSEVAAQFERHLGASRPERVARTTAWDRWWVLVGAFTLWGTAWGLRRWSGLV